MATDNNKGLYLPLKINLDDWEKDLLKADVDLQKAMREMRSSMKDLRMKYDVEIVGAKVAGNQTKALELETAKLNRLYEEQKRAVEALNRAYQQSVKDKGQDAKASQDLARQLINESKQLDRLKAQIDSKGLNIGKKLSDGLATASPEFARIRSLVSGVTSELGSIGGVATTAAKAIGGIGMAVAGLGAVYTALEKVTDGVNDLAKAGLAAADPVYQLRESIQGTYDDAEFLRNVTAVDGSSAESLANSITKLISTLKKDEEQTGATTQALRKWGANILDAEGNAKSYRAILIELSKAAQKAAEAGQYADFKAMLPGSFRTTEFDHLLLGLDNYIDLSELATIETKIFYDQLHKVGDLQNSLALAKTQREAILGGIYSEAAAENLRYEIDTVVALNKILDENKDKYGEVADYLGNITTAWIEMKSSALLAWEEIKADMVTVIEYFDEIENATKKFYAINPMSFFPELLKEFMGGDYIQEKVDEAKQKLAEKQEEQQHENVLRQLEREMVRETQELLAEEQAQEVKKTKQQEQEEKKRLEVMKRFQKELRDATATEYEREINALNDKRQAYIDEGVAEVEANKLFNEQKAQVDKKYFNKLQAERQKQAKDAEAAYQKEVEAAKKARESAISEADSTVKNNLKLIRYIKKQQEEGTYNEDDVKKYAERLYMKQNGYRQSDIDTAKGIGIQKLQELADARSRIFGQFAPTAPTTNNNTVNITFDNTVVEDVSALDKIANRVAEVITPAIEQALKGGTTYSY